VGRAARARRIAARAAYGGGGLLGLGAGFYGVLLAEAGLARRWVGAPTDEPFDADGVYGAELTGVALRLAVLGDSGAAGVGVIAPEQTPGALLAASLAPIVGRPVELRSVAVVGAQSSGLLGQIDQIEPWSPDIAMVMIGANDVTHRVRPGASARHLDQAVRRLVATGTTVVVGTCPDLGTLEPVKHPLRLVARRRSRELAAVQAITVVEAGGRAVSLGDVLGPEFAASPREMFSADRFHPSAAGYARCAAVLLPSMCAALDLPPLETEPADAAGEVLLPAAEVDLEAVLPVSDAAAEAAQEAGTEISAAIVEGRERGPRGRWVRLRHRRVRASGSPPPEPKYASADTETPYDDSSDVSVGT
jgi:lysophospholipase L1-like esterase